eukprot:1191865-Prorocentrum_minimum.AAC.3
MQVGDGAGVSGGVGVSGGGGGCHCCAVRGAVRAGQEAAAPVLQGHMAASPQPRGVIMASMRRRTF